MPVEIEAKTALNQKPPLNIVDLNWPPKNPTPLVLVASSLPVGDTDAPLVKTSRDEDDEDKETLVVATLLFLTIRFPSGSRLR